MDPELAQIFDFVGMVLPIVAVIVVVSVAGWIFTTWLRIKNGYPLETSWGVPLHPSSDRESQERIKLLTGENAQLRAEMGAVKDRLETIERIVTDSGTQTAAQIEALRDQPRTRSGETTR
jgi:hypothetical protein